LFQHNGDSEQEKEQMKNQNIYKRLPDLQTMIKSLNLIDQNLSLDFTWVLKQNKRETEALIAQGQENTKSGQLCKEKLFTLEMDSVLT